VVAASGKVPVKVSTENGAIYPGDALTSSTTPGVAMKATGNSPIVGRATSGYDGEGVNKIVVLVDNGFSPSSIGGFMDLSDLSERLGKLEDKVYGVESDQPAAAESDTGLRGADGQDVSFEQLTVGTMAVELDLVVKGAMVVEGPATFEGAARFMSDVEIAGNVNISGSTTFGSDTAGYAVVGAGQSGVKVKFTEPLPTVPVISLTLGNGKFAQYSYRNVTNEGFEIILSEPADDNLEFSWTATNVNGANTYVSSN